MEKGAATNQEIEIKLDLGSFPNYLKLLGFLGEVDDEEHHLSVFFDTPDRKLSQAGWALRVRVENDCGRITLKGTSSSADDAAVRDEFDSRISRSLASDIVHERAELLSLDHEPVARARKVLKKELVAPVIQYENERKKKSMRLEDFEYVFEVDKTEFADGSVDYELEIELPDVNRIDRVSDRLQKIFRSLDIPYERQSESKFARALQRSGIE